jgi:quercetin dioxygenase-like cupin family protein
LDDLVGRHLADLRRLGSPFMTSTTPRRIVTGHDESGRSIVLADGPNPTTRVLPTGVLFHEIWSTAGAPAPISAAEPGEPTARPLQVAPDPLGSLVRVIDMPPGSSADIHRTRTVDYGVVLEGEVVLELDDGSETSFGTGDVVVQRGTAHAWYNRSQSVARMLFVMVDAAFTDELRSTLGEEALSQILEGPLE